MALGTATLVDSGDKSKLILISQGRHQDNTQKIYAKQYTMRVLNANKPVELGTTKLVDSGDKS